MRRRRSDTSQYAILCRYCRAQIEGCDGAFGDWMHVDTRREHCRSGRTLAEPETLLQYDGRQSATGRARITAVAG